MTHPTRHVIPDPFPETIGCSALTIFAPEDFRGDVEIIWWYPGKSGDEDKQRITCSTTALLQGVFRDVRGARPGQMFDARVIALVLHAFYRARIEAAARLESAYQWQAWRAAGQQSIAEGRLPSLLPSGDKKHGEGDEP